jgi:hypothetical protein
MTARRTLTHKCMPAEHRNRERTPRALFPAGTEAGSCCASAATAAPSHSTAGTAAAKVQSWAMCCTSLRSSTHRLVFPRVVRYGVPAFVTAIVVGVVHPAVLVFAAAMALLMVIISLLPEGHVLLSYAYMREVRLPLRTCSHAC